MPDLWDDLDQQVEDLFREGQLPSAALAAEKALAMVDHALGPLHPEVADHLNTLGALNRLQSHFAQAKGYHRQTH